MKKKIRASLSQRDFKKINPQDTYFINDSLSNTSESISEEGEQRESLLDMGNEKLQETKNCENNDKVFRNMITAKLEQQSCSNIPSTISKSLLTIEKENYKNSKQNTAQSEEKNEVKKKTAQTKESIKILNSITKFSEFPMEYVKSFDFYFFEGNIKNFIERYREFQKSQRNKRRKNSRVKIEKTKFKTGYGFLNKEEFQFKFNLSTNLSCALTPKWRHTTNTKEIKTLPSEKGFFSKEYPKKLNFMDLVNQAKEKNKDKKEKINKN